MISLTRTDGARKDLLELCTHNPRKNGSTIDVYTEFPWEALCGEVGKLKLVRPEPVALPPESAIGEPTPADAEKAGELDSSDPPLATREPIPESFQGVDEWRRRESNPRSGILKTPTVTRICPSNAATSKRFLLPSRSTPFRLVPPRSPQSWQNTWQNTHVRQSPTSSGDNVGIMRHLVVSRCAPASSVLPGASPGRPLGAMGPPPHSRRRFGALASGRATFRSSPAVRRSCS